MGYALVFLLGVVAGGISFLGILTAKRNSLNAQERKQQAQKVDIQETLKAIAKEQSEFEQQKANLNAEYAAKEEHFARESASRKADLDLKAAHLLQGLTALETRLVSYQELHKENSILKHDLQNIDVNVRKLELDQQLQREEHERIDLRSRELGVRYLKENVSWIGSSLTANNYVSCKERLKAVIERCRGIGFDVSATEEDALLTDLKKEYERVVRAALEREEQIRIKAQIREEQAREREIERELAQLDRERAAIKAALDKALADTNDRHSSQIQSLEARLADAEARSQRAISQAQLTKAGHVYVISNLGSLGEGVYKIGMTRRLEPLDRIRELGDASVPFPFDIHMMISCDDAPTLENALHRTLHKHRLNKINPRKEFFRTDFDAIRAIVEKHHGEVQYTADTKALEFRQSLSMSDEDQEFIENLYEGLSETEDSIQSEEE